MSSTKKNDLQRDFAAGVFLSEAPSLSTTPYPPPLTHCIRVYCILIHTKLFTGQFF